MPISFQRKNINLNYDSTMKKYRTSKELPNKIEAFLKFQQQCMSNNIKLYVVFSPNFCAHNPSFEERLRQLACPEVSFYIYNTDNAIYHNDSYFYDDSHLQINGAIIFTNEIINKLNRPHVLMHMVY